MSIPIEVAGRIVVNNLATPERIPIEIWRTVEPIWEQQGLTIEETIDRYIDELSKAARRASANELEGTVR